MTILSICIPTYNRAKSLNILLEGLALVDEEIKKEFEICISNNNSNDETESVIDRWQKKLPIRRIRQNENIGATRNFQAVAKTAQSDWIILLGDDDAIDNKNLIKLIKKLKNYEKKSWILLDVANSTGGTLLNKNENGLFNAKEIKREILFGNLFIGIGFMSMHIIPMESIKKFIKMDLKEIYAWPHLALFIKELKNNKIYIEKETVVIRGGSADEITQTWRPEDWFCIMMQKTKLICNSNSDGMIFNSLMAMREYMGWPYLRQSLLTKLKTNNEFDIYCKAVEYINDTDILKEVKFIIKIYIKMILLIPIKLIKIIYNIREKIRGDKNSKDDYKLESETDGIRRGL
jgi:glycosyltransferase involved in cell wall biosynthesis